MNAPFLLLALSLFISMIAFGLRDQARWSSTWVSLSMGVVAGMVLLVGFDEPYGLLGLSIKLPSQWGILGRSLGIGGEIRPMIGYLYLATAFMVAPAWIVGAPRYFTSIVPLMLAAVAASLMVQPFLFAAIFIGLAAMGAVLLLVSPGTRSTSGAMRLLILYTLAMIIVLVTGWQLETSGVTSAAGSLATQVTALLAFGFAILLAIPPFHLWLPRVVQEANVYVVFFVAVILQGAGLFFLFRFLDTYPWLRESTALFSGIAWAGGITVLLAAIWAAGQREPRTMAAYCLLVDLGVMLVAIGNGSRAGLELALGISGARVISLAVLSLGMGYLVRVEGSSWRGAGFRRPLASMTFLVGLLSIIGYPLTAGFPARWSLLAAIRGGEPLLSWVIILAMMLLTGSILRWAAFLFSPSDDIQRRDTPLTVSLFLYGGIAITVMLGVFPQVIFPWVVETAAGLTRLFP
jgi:multicomponent Na+:H+ antiporter subunit D